MDKIEAIRKSKEFRVELDGILQRMKAHKIELVSMSASNYKAQAVEGGVLHSIDKATLPDDLPETIAHHVLSYRSLEDAIMRQGMVLKSIGNPTPYPESYDPKSSVVHPTADVKL